MRGFTRLLQTAVLLLFVVGQALGGTPTWTVTNYTNSTTVTGQNFIAKDVNGVTISAAAGDYIGAFVGTECRMKAVLFTSGTSLYISGVIQGGYSGTPVTGEPTTNAGEELTFKLYKVTTDQEYVLLGTTFTIPGDHIDLYPIGKPNTNSSLKSLAVTGATLSPAFAATTTSYTATASTLPDLAAIAAVKADSRAKVAITNAKDLSSDVVADRTLTIVVTAEDGTSTTYTVVYAKTTCSVAAPTTSNLTVCEKDPSASKVLSAQGLNNATFTWYDANKKTVATTATFTPTAAGTYTVTQKTTCEGAPATAVYTINANPVATLTGETTYCGTTGATLTAGSNIGSAAIYKVGETTVATAPYLTGSYIAVATAGTCKDSSDVVAVTAKEKPTYTIAGGGSVCKGAKADITVSITGTAPFTIAYAIDGTAQTEETISSTTYTISAATTGAGSKVYSLASLKGACAADIDAAKKAEVTVVAVPTVTVDSKSACAGGTAVLTANSPAGEVTWVDGTTKTTGNTFSATSSKTVSVYQTVSGCTSESVQATATVNAKPTVTLDIAPSMCLGSTATVTAKPDGGVLLIDGVAQNSVSFAPTAAGSYTVKYGYSDVNKCTDTASKTVVVTSTPKPTVNPSSVSIKTGDAIPTFAATGDATASFSWTGKKVDNITDTTASGANFTPKVSNAKSAVYSYTVKQILNTCESEPVTVSLTVSTCTTSPVSTIINKDAKVCLGDQNPTFEAKGEANATYAWYDKDNKSVATTATFQPKDQNAGTYTYSVVQSVGGCPSSATTASFTINALPEAPVITVTKACPGEMSRLSSTATGLVWYDATNSVVESAASTTVAKFYATQKDANGCTSAKASESTAFYTSPAAPVVTVTPACKGGISKLTAEGTGVKWYNVNKELTTDPSAGVVTAFTAISVDANGCKSEGVTKSTIINDLPAAPQIVVTKACPGEASTLSATGSNLVWKKAGVVTTTLSSTTVETFTVTQTDANNCTSEAGSAQTAFYAKPSVPTVNPEYSVAANATSVLVSAIGEEGSKITWKYNTKSETSLSGADLTLTGLTTLPTTVLVSQKTVAGCSSDDATVTIKLNPCNPPAKPTVSGASAPICAGTTTKLTANSYDAASYKWYSGTTVVANTADYVAAVGTFYVSALNAECESDKVAVTVSAKQITKPTISAPASIKISDPKVQIVVTPASGTITADIPASVVDGYFVPASSTVGSHKITYTVQGDCGSLSVETTITVAAADLEGLTAVIKAAQDRVDYSPYGTTVGTYPTQSGTDLQAAIDVAKQVIAKGVNATPEEITKAVKDLTDAIKKFDDSVIKPGTIDKSALEKAIADATTASTTNVGTEPGQHTASAAQILKDAITKAKADSVGADQAKIDVITKTLTDAIAKYDTTVNPPVVIDVTPVNLKVEELQALVDSIKTAQAIASTGYGKFPQTAITAAVNAITAAETAKAAAKTAADVTKIVGDLNAAITALRASQIKTVTLTIVDSGIDPTVGKSYVFDVTSDGPASTITYSSSNTKVATVDENGQIQFVATGSVTITASTVVNGKTYTAKKTYTVTDNTAIADKIAVNIKLSPVPTVDVLKISGVAEIVTIRITSIDAKELVISNNGDATVEVNVADLASATYTVTCVAKDGSIVTSKFVK